jgi:hypothetical protein
MVAAKGSFFQVVAMKNGAHVEKMEALPLSLLIAKTNNKKNK